MRLKNVIFDKKEYTLVDFYEWNENEIIYHFAGDELDLFCNKNENNYLIIRNEEKIDEIMEYYLLKKPDIYFGLSLPAQTMRLLGVTKLKRVPIETRKEILDETIKKIGQLKSGVTQDLLEKRLTNVKIYSGKWLGGLSEMLAFYHPGANTVVLSEENGFDNKGKRTCLHEMIHAISGQGFLYSTVFSNYTGLIEGATENIVEKIYGNKKSRNDVQIQFGNNGSKHRITQYNFSKDVTYPDQVALIRQMEYALQIECTESTLMGKFDFFRKFAQTYGKDTLRFVRHRANRLLHPEKLKNYTQYLKDTQDTLLEVIFNKDLEGVEDLETAANYLKKLQDFELSRVKITERNKDGKFDKDTSFEELYNSKLQTIKERLIQKGFNENDVMSMINKHLYRESQFLPKETAEEQDKRIEKIITENISKSIESGQVTADKLKEFKAYVSKRKDGEVLIITRAGKPVSMKINSKNEFGLSNSKSYDFKKTIPEGFSFAQDEGVFFISSPDGTEILLDEVTLTPDFQQKVQKKIESNRTPTKQEQTSTSKSQTQMEEIKKIANTQNITRVNQMIAKLRAKIKGIGEKTKEEGVENDRD